MCSAGKQDISSAFVIVSWTDLLYNCAGIDCIGVVAIRIIVNARVWHIAGFAHLCCLQHETLVNPSSACSWETLLLHSHSNEVVLAQQLLGRCKCRYICLLELSSSELLQEEMCLVLVGIAAMQN